VCVGREAEVDHAVGQAPAAATTSNPLSSTPPDLIILIWVLIDFSSIYEIYGPFLS
jgi:hypothetical protein